MIPDVKIRDYYLQFIYKAKIDVVEYQKIIKETNDKLNNTIEYINEHKRYIEDNFNIDLNDYKEEWIYKSYNPNELLYKRIIKINNLISDSSSKVVALQIIKYCHLIKQVYKYNRLIKLADKRQSITFKEYRGIVTKYYNKVHKCILEGMGYKYGYGIGTYCVNHWKINKDKRKKKIVDFAATNARKKELLAKGCKLYDDKEAAWYKERNIPYDGVDYRVYKDDNSYYEFVFIDSKLFKYDGYEYKRTEYVVNKHRGMSYKEIADKLCNNLEDIYNLQVDIRYKLNILLYKDPTKYLNFIRNAEQNKYKY